MKSSIRIFAAVFSFIIAACSTSASQVTVTSEVTVTLPPPPTEPLVPTPTLHPQFAALQETIAASGGRFTLGADGLLYDNNTSIPGITVALDGTMTLTVNGETVTLDPADVNFDDENGISIDGYDWDEEQGGWVETMSEARKAAEQHFADLGYPTDGVEFVEGEVTVTGRVDGVKVFEMNIKSGEVMFDENFAIEQAGQQELMPTEIEEYVMGSSDPVAKAYFVPLFERAKGEFIKQFGHEIPYKVGWKIVEIDDDISAWGAIMLNSKDENARRYLIYELGDSDVMGQGTIVIVPLMPEK